MTPDELRQLFPSITPIKRPPGLFTLNGIGFTVYGGRDRDPQTGTYIKTYCFCFVFIPLLALSAYRVADSPNRGWYFLGKEPLSGFAKAWNFLLVGLIAAVIGWFQYAEWHNSPERRAERQLVEAKRQEAAGNLVDAASAYVEALPYRAEEGKAGLRGIANDRLAGAPLQTVVDVARVLVGTAHYGSLDAAWAPRMLDRVEKERDQSPKEALALLGMLHPLVADAKVYAKLEEKCLESVLARDRRDVDAAVRLAKILEAREEIDRCETILEPVADHLGDGDGARILGQILAKKGDTEGSFRLLQPYVQGRLAKYHAAEKAFEQSIEGAQTRAIADLNANRAAPDWYARYQKATEPAQKQMVQEYTRDHLLHDPIVASARGALEQASDVVPVALNLGIVRLNRAQGMTDPTARKAELEEAEKVFLAVSGAAGESDTYRIFLGQVKYWLGKHDDGKKLFDEYLVSKSRAPKALLEIAEQLRYLGAESEARPMSEEAYGSATDAEDKQAAAGLRSLMRVDDDDEITWLERSDTSSPHTQACLAEARGRKAHDAGDDATAEARFRESVDLYRKVPETGASVNNLALALSQLYQVTGKVEYFEQVADLFAKAERLQPENSILLSNSAEMLIERAVLELAKGSLDLETLKPYPGLGLLTDLYGTAGERAEIVANLVANPDVKGALERLAKVLVLCPKSARPYSELLGVYGLTKDAGAIEALAKRLDGVDLDITDMAGHYLDRYTGKEEAQDLAEAKTTLIRLQRVADLARKKGGAATIAAACANLAGGMRQVEALGGECNFDAAVAAAEEGYRAKVTSSSRSALADALLARAVHRVAGGTPAFVRLRASTRRMLGLAQCVALAIETGDDAIKAALAGDADAKRWIAILLEEARAFPEDRSPSEWAVLRGFDEGAAQEAAKAFREAKVPALTLELMARVIPMDASTAYERHWARLLAGDEAGAQAVLDDLAKLGVPVPGR